MNELTIADIAIRQDAQGRYCLNDLHRAAGGHSNHQPALWLRNKQTQDLIAELGRSTNSQNDENQSLMVYQGGNGPQGTYGCWELVYAYAMWISAAFHLQVIRAYDASVRPALDDYPPIPPGLPDFTNPGAAAHAWAEQFEQREQLALENQAQAQALALAAPKVEALDRIATADGSLCITDAAKSLQMRPRGLFKWMSANHWIYQRVGHHGWLAYQDRIQCGLMEHKVTVVQSNDGSDRCIEQARITAKGLARLAETIREAMPLMQPVLGNNLQNGESRLGA